jgi:hypothetical protein
MTICQKLPCKECGDEFHATFDDDDLMPEYCENCRGEPAKTPAAQSAALDPMSKLIVPSTEHLDF